MRPGERAGSGADQGRVETVQRMLAAFDRRDLDALAAEADPDIQVQPAVVGGLEGTVYRGHAGLREFVADLDESWRTFRLDVEEFRDVGEAVVVLGRTLAEGMESGVRLDTASGFVFGVRDGKVHSFRSFLGKDAALAAAGLSE